MLVTLNDVLIDAQKNKYAVGLFNTVNLEMAKGVLAAAEETRSPVIIGTAEVLLPYAGLEDLSYFLVPMAKKAKVPVVLHFDHGLTPELIIKSMSLGFRSIMYDCSVNTLEENITKCREMAKIAKIFGASIEAELGHVGAAGSDAAEADGHDSIYTDPLQAKEFVESTNVDALAVAIGTAHGAYKSKPQLDLKRLKEIASTINTPLVLHGGSGLSDEDFKNCINNGIAKVNIFTDINCAAAKAAADGYKKGCGMTDLMGNIIDEIKEATMKKMNIFGCVRKA
ncbi:ketose-bisphosphate aldolase class-ii [Lucifera butyrica]|uniref:Ketose-bisphosphate aldolase class-ii n=1 Tax=Lucifera butyrica TaxID=1351585 RepID=A0A498R733_9FIRM|nr:class II fructose-bisphosphate aldolase [Lucifera butyrica]VBB04938.1 ketose-bisphosphate aldolase class-ii [Lucifera butyrica]